MNNWSLIIFLYSIYFVSVCISQVCKESSDETQCNTGEICVGSICQQAVECEDDKPCSSEQHCQADFCQPNSCSSIGQCVHGHVCSQDSRCVYSKRYPVEEGAEFTLKFEEPGVSYDTMTWYKTSRSNTIVSFDPDNVFGQLQYYGDYCSGSGPCFCSTKAEFDPSNGNLRIYSLNLTEDEDYYYYEFSSFDRRCQDTGLKYEIYLEIFVPPNKETTIISGLPEIIPDGMKVILNCLVPRIKPAALDIYWNIDGMKSNGSLTTIPLGDGTFAQHNTLEINFTKEDDGKTLQCIVDAVHGDSVTTEEIINVEYSPIGSPTLPNVTLEIPLNQKVTLNCDTNSTEANPKCDTFLWNKTNDDTGQFPKIMFTDTIEFVMQDSSVGNYTCQCRNKYGLSEISVPLELTVLHLGTTDGEDVTLTIVLGVMMGFFVFVCVGLVGHIVYSRRKRPSRDSFSRPPPTETELRNPCQEVTRQQMVPKSRELNVNVINIEQPLALEQRSVRNNYIKSLPQTSAGHRVPYQNVHLDSQDAQYDDVYENINAFQQEVYEDVDA